MTSSEVKVLLLDDSPEDITIIERLLLQFERARFSILSTNSQVPAWSCCRPRSPTY